MDTRARNGHGKQRVIINLALATVALGILVVAGTAGFGLGAPKAPVGSPWRSC
jgi:hypothetical protein